MSGLGDRVPVEPLGDEALVRIERRVMTAYEEAAASPAPGWRSLRWLAPAAAIAGVALAIALHLRAAADPERIVTVAPPDAPIELVHREDGASYAVAGTMVHVAPGTRARLHRGQGGAITVELELGRVQCEVEPRRERPPFVVRAGETSVTVVGTAFAVDRRADGAVAVEVSRGAVRVDDPAGARQVAAGERWSTGPEIEPEAIVPEDPNGAGSAATALLDAADRAPRKRTSQAPPSRSGPARGADRATDGDVGGPHGRHAPLAPAEAFAGVGSAALDEIMALEEGDAAEAARRYRSFSLEHSGSEAARALYSEAYLRFFRLKDRAGALRAMDLYDRRFPTDARSESALWLRVQILCDGGVTRACRAAAHTYLRRFPSGTWSAAARHLTQQ